MTKSEIRARMVKAINDSFEDYLENELDYESLIDEDVLHDFLWEKDFGREIYQDFIYDNATEIAKEFLEDIYNEIDETDLSFRL